VGAGGVAVDGGAVGVDRGCVPPGSFQRPARAEQLPRRRVVTLGTVATQQRTDDILESAHGQMDSLP
jgi:hypothetical protein